MAVWAKSKQKIAKINFEEQIKALKLKAKEDNLLVLSKEAGLKEYRLYKLCSEPWMMRIYEQWLLSALFTKYGLTFDATLGMGGAQNAAVVY